MAVYYFNYQSPDAPSLTSAAGTLINVLDYCLVTGMGWEKVFTGTNVATYRAPTGNRFYLGVTDTTGTSARIRGFETATAAGTVEANGTGDFPTDAQLSGGNYFWKNNSSSAADWAFFSDGLMFYLTVLTTGSSYGNMMAFGDFITYGAIDIFNTIIFGENSSDSNAATGLAQEVGTTATICYKTIARPYTQIGGSVLAHMLGDYTKSGATTFGAGGTPFPNPITNTLDIGSVEILENRTLIRGRMPGLYFPKHNRPLAHNAVVSGSGALAGKQFVARTINSGTSTFGQMFFEISDTWRT